MEKIVVEYQIKDNIVRVVKVPRKFSFKYVFEYQTANRLDLHTRTTVVYKSLRSALKQFNKAISALNNGTNIR